MTSFYTIETANARVPEVREVLLLLREQRRDLIRLRDRLIELVGDDAGTGRSVPDEAAPPEDTAPSPLPAGSVSAADEEARLIRLRMQGLVDQMQASVARIDGWGITLRDIESGLIDFPALASGRQIWLCWRLGEDGVDWWHRVDEGFAGRRRLADLD